MAIGRLRVVTQLHRPLSIPEYVYQQELVGPRARDKTRVAARRTKEDGTVSLEILSLADLQRIAALNAPRRKAGLGELACGVLAERLSGGVLCDDRRAVGWMRNEMRVLLWQSIEDVLIAAAHSSHLSESDLDQCERGLLEARYTCKFGLKNTYLMQLLANRSPGLS